MDLQESMECYWHKAVFRGSLGLGCTPLSTICAVNFISLIKKLGDRCKLGESRVHWTVTYGLFLGRLPPGWEFINSRNNELKKGNLFSKSMIYSHSKNSRKFGLF